jgi:hypothetical protein
MHRYELPELVGPYEYPGLPTWPLAGALDLERQIIRERFVAQRTYPEVWHLDNHGLFSCGYRGCTGDSVREWADDPADLRRSRREGLADNGCAPNWLIIEPRPAWLFPDGPIDEGDGEQFLRLRRHLADVGVTLVDAVLVVEDRWWSLHELVSGTTEWTMSVGR